MHSRQALTTKPCPSAGIYLQYNCWVSCSMTIPPPPPAKLPVAPRAWISGTDGNYCSQATSGCPKFPPSC